MTTSLPEQSFLQAVSHIDEITVLTFLFLNGILTAKYIYIYIDALTDPKSEANKEPRPRFCCLIVRRGCGNTKHIPKEELNLFRQRGSRQSCPAAYSGIFKLFLTFIGVAAHACHDIYVGVREHLEGVGSLLLP